MNDFRHTEKLQRQKRAFPATVYPVFTIVDISRYCSTLVKTETDIGTLLVTELQTLFEFCQLPFETVGGELDAG